jgi:4a-hydroxytetrahydrobiopterin dehydratase
MVQRLLLTEVELRENLSRLNDWKIDGKLLKRRFEFENFTAALSFVNKVALIAEAMDHHPDIYFGWGYAEITLTTHDRGGITDLDFLIASEINGI